MAQKKGHFDNNQNDLFLFYLKTYFLAFFSSIISFILSIAAPPIQ